MDGRLGFYGFYLFKIELYVSVNNYRRYVKKYKNTKIQVCPVTKYNTIVFNSCHDRVKPSDMH